MAATQVTGTLIEHGTGRPMAGMYVEIYGSGSMPAMQQFWMGGATVNKDGNFSVFLREDTPTPELPLVLVVFYGDHVIHTETIYNLSVGDINVPTTYYSFYYSYYYQTEVVDATHDRNENLFFIIHGRLTGEDGRGIANERINACIRGFRNYSIVCRAETDANGYYTMKIAYLSLNSGRTMFLEVDSVEIEGGRSEDITSFPLKQEVNIQVSFYEDYEYETDWIYLAIEEATGYWDMVDQYQITIDGPDRETIYISEVTGVEESYLIMYLRAMKMAFALGAYTYVYYSATTNFIYTLLKKGYPADPNAIYGLPFETLWGIWTEATETYIVHPWWLINFGSTVYNSFSNGTAAKTLDLPIAGADMSYGTYYGSVFGAGGVVPDYFRFLRQHMDVSTPELWELMSEDGYLSPWVPGLQETFRLATITGCQINMTNYLWEGVNMYAIWNDVSDMAEMPLEAWEDHINYAGGESAVPQAIIEHYPGDPIENYAKLLKSFTQDAFAGAALLGKLDGPDGELLIPDEELRYQVAAFLASNPAFDFRKYSVYDIEPETFELSFVLSADVLIDVMVPFQTLSRITDSKVDAVVTLKIGGYDSGTAIFAAQKDEFVVEFGPVLGGEEEATAAYETAGRIATISAHATTHFTTSVNGPKFSWNNGDTTITPHTNPDIATLFGSLVQCGCSECMSVYSPGAYFVDIMNFLKKLDKGPINVYRELTRRRPDLPYIDITCKNANTPVPYIDLVNEQLERLIMETAAYSGATPPPSFQTTGSAADLSAYPEHVYRSSGGLYVDFADYEKIYDEVLPAGKYPDVLPFRLPLEEARVYLQHLGYTRQRLMEMYWPYDETIPANEITPVNYYTESAGMSKEAADIIINAGSGGTPWIYYGFEQEDDIWYLSPTDSSVYLKGSWDELLRGDIPGDNQGGLDVLLYILKISFRELRQLLQVDLLNPVDGGVRRVSIQPRAGAPLDTCDLRKLRLQITGGGSNAFFDKLHRFVRLWRGTGLSIYELDLLLRALGATDIVDTTGNLVYTNLMRALHLSRKLNLPIDRLVTWWTLIDTRHYVNYNSDRQDALPSLYDQLFRNRNVQNPPDRAFDNTPTNPLDHHIYGANTATIIAATGITEEELVMVMSKVGLSTSAGMSLVGLTKLFISATMARALKMTVTDFIRFCEMNSIAYAAVTDTPTPGGAESRLLKLEELMSKLEALGRSGLTLSDVRYLLLNADEEGAYIPVDETIQPFYEGMRAELKKVYVDTADMDDPDKVEALKDALRNIIVQRFAASVNLEPSIVLHLLKDLFEIGYDATGNGAYAEVPVLNALIDGNFINAEYPLSVASIESIMHPSTPPQPGGWPTVNLDDLYPLYRRVAKIARLVALSGIHREELELLQSYYFELKLPDLRDLLYEGSQPTDNGLYPPLMRYLNWVRLRRQLRLTGEFFEAIVKLSLPTGGTRSAWQEKVQEITQWDMNLILQLTGTNTPGVPDGILYLTYPQSYFDPGVLLRISELAYVSGRTGLIPRVLVRSLYTDLVMADSRNIRRAARSKHDEAGWAKVAKPLQDPLRKKQRDALVAYVLAHPVFPPETPPTPPAPEVDTRIWRTENDLYAWLMIDVEMEPCMMSSRIRQAINSVQLYVDRVIMNMEYYNGNPAHMLSLDPTLVQQWKAWRKWYRIWEANRKIFLYPENWIEPELRDNKTEFFRELEQQLLQDELNEQSVERAFLGYLEKLSEVGRLEPVTVYHQSEPAVGIDILHVIARTVTDPKIYYYRRLIDGEWTGWEKMNVDPKSDHITAVVWNRRLYMIWLDFLEHKFETDGQKQLNELLDRIRRWNLKDYSSLNYSTRWMCAWRAEELQEMWQEVREQKMEISTVRDAFQKGWAARINWSEYRDGRWGPPKTGSEQMKLFPFMIVMPPQYTDAMKGAVDTREFKSESRFLTKNYQISFNEFFKSRLYLYPFLTSARELILGILFPSNNTEASLTMHAFRWIDNSSDPIVVQQWNQALYNYKLLSPANTLMSGMKFLSTPLNQNNPLVVDENTVTNGRAYFIYPWSGLSEFAFQHYDRTGQGIILGRSHGNQPYRITGKANMSQVNGANAPTYDHFFYEDADHIFFVRRRKPRVSVVSRDVSDNNKISATSAVERVEGDFDFPTSQGNPPDGRPTTSLSARYLVPENTYYFQTYYHSHIRQFIQALNRFGIDGLLRLQMQVPTDSMNFEALYAPTSAVIRKPAPRPYPTNIVDFEYDGAYSIYNWELFFHIPMMMAQRLSADQQFEAAQKWFHYIFDPTSNTNDQGQISSSKQRFWRCRPFYEEAGKEIVTLADMMSRINEYAEQVAQWEKHPFSPHVIARMRILAYMKNTVMKYLDNLIAWGDQLFRRDTVESINEATQLYILASNILGRKPEIIPPVATPVIQNFDQLLTAGLDAFSNARVYMERFVDPYSFPTGWGSSEPPTMMYFCLPQNDKLLGYWDTVADRLFKIRNCMNIEGVVRQLPLFDPPIDPAMLVRATAQGMDINSVLNEVAGIGLPYYRFRYVLQRANELCSDVKALGSAILSALEKKDAEELALLRAGQEIKVLESVKALREIQVKEAEQALEALMKTREVTEVKLQYYSTRPYMNSGEQKHLESLEKGVGLQIAQTIIESIVGTISIIPNFHAQATASGVSIGGLNFAGLIKAGATVLAVKSIINSAQGTMAVTRAGYDRRRDDWRFQVDSAQKELAQVDKQILGAQIRLQIAQKELQNQELQIENSKAVDEFMRNKYTNVELYNWMIGQISAVFFQSYQLAFDVARKAELCLRKEIPFAIPKMPAGGFIKFGYWDSLRKGMLSGEKLQYDLRKMESFYMESNKRELELTKHVSMALLDPSALLMLRTTGTCSITIPEELFDLDYPGQYMRRIKTVSVSIPCVAGPYTTINCKLSQTSSKYRKNTSLTPDGKYEENPVNGDPRFEYITNGDTIATSSAQNDSGVFELNFGDDRYLPFEGAGAISDWTISIPNEFPLFDPDTIRDVILHIKYTAQDGGTLAAKANEHLAAFLAVAGENFPAYFSLKDEFPDEWTAAFEETVPVTGSTPGEGTPLNIPLTHSLFPSYTRKMDIEVEEQEFYLLLVDPTPPDVEYCILVNGTEFVSLSHLPSGYWYGKTAATVNLSPGSGPEAMDIVLYKVVDSIPEAIPLEADEVDNLFMTLNYSIS
jgi:hypothetical protein